MKHCGSWAQYSFPWIQSTSLLLFFLIARVFSITDSEPFDLLHKWFYEQISQMTASISEERSYLYDHTSLGFNISCHTFASDYCSRYFVSATVSWKYEENKKSRIARVFSMTQEKETVMGHSFCLRAYVLVSGLGQSVKPSVAEKTEAMQTILPPRR